MTQDCSAHSPDEQPRERALLSSAPGGRWVGPALALLGGLAVIVGVFLSWADVVVTGPVASDTERLDLTVNGLGSLTGSPDAAAAHVSSSVTGHLAITAGVVSLIGGAVVLGSKRSIGYLPAGVGALVAVGIAMVEVSRAAAVRSDLEYLFGQMMQRPLPNGAVQVSIGSGVFVVLVGGAVVLGGALIGLVDARMSAVRRTP